MSISPTSPSMVADYFFVTGLCDDDLLLTYQQVQKGFDQFNEASYYLNQQTSAAEKTPDISTLQLNSDTSYSSPPPPSTTTVTDNNNINTTTTTTTNNNTLSKSQTRRKRGFSLPPIISDTLPSKDSLNDVLDHVQTVIDNFDKERDTARDSVIAISTTTSPTQLAQSPNTNDHTRRASLKSTNHHRNSFSKRLSLHDTTWHHFDSIKRRSTFSLSNQDHYVRSRSISNPKDILSENQPHQLHDHEKVAVVVEEKEDEDENDLPTMPHLLDVKYPPTVLMRYPSQDLSIPFPSYLSMFCFPRDISLYYGEEPPPEKIHSFAITNDTGSTLYGTCCIFYEPLSNDLIDSVDDSLKNWVNKNIPSSTVEYAKHLEEKLENEKLHIEQCNAELASLLSSSSTSSNDTERQQELEERIRLSSETLILYKELLEPIKLAICKPQRIWMPKSIGLLGRLPWLDFYSDWTKILLDAVVGVRGKKNNDLSIDVKNAVENLLFHIPLPPPGRFEIGFTINSKPLYISRPAMNEVPVLKNFSLYPLFRALSPHLIMAVLETILAEGKIIFLSEHCSMLSLACESFRYLIFPFYWQFIFIPLLPDKLLTCLQAPVPYIVGFNGNMDEIEEFVPDDALIVNLDINTIHQSSRAPMLPDRQRRKLQASIELHCPLHNKYRVPYGIPLSMQTAFPNGRLLLSSNKSKSQEPIETPAARHRMSEASDNSSVWSGSKMSWQLPLSTGIWSNTGSRRNSNESFSSTYSNNNSNNSNNNHYTSTITTTTTSQHHYSPHISSLQQQNTNYNQSKQRSSMPVSNGNNDSSLFRPQNRLSDPAPRKQDLFDKFSNELQSNGMLSGGMSKPMATFQQTPDQSISSMSSPSFNRSWIPATITENNYNLNQNHQQSTVNEVSRHVKHVEGHIMATLFPQELFSFQGYRCLCGKPVEHEHLSVDNIYRICQECHLVTHDSCTDQILHPCLPACFDETKIQDTFLRMFASLLYGYRHGFMDPSDTPIANKSYIINNNNNNNQNNNVNGGGNRQRRKSIFFSKDSFLKHSDKDTRSYLATLANSQMFTQFITDRLSKPLNDPEILMFDEYIKLKLNRSKLRLVKENTPFLNDDSYRISQVLWTGTSENEPSIIYDRFPTNFS
ncbi:AEX-3 domain-containing protein [Cunninghamella echinulata]|nr:AEX-3 domain-containing protein [Cunninghamella echinulata]